MAPMLEAPGPRTSVFSSMRSAFVHATMMGTPAALCVNVPDPSGNTVADMVAVAGIGSAVGSV